MKEFLDWFNSTPDTDSVLRAGVAHLWFVTIHPFEDGNGRIGRALTSMVLAHSKDSPVRFYSMSGRILRERADYYRALGRATRGTCDITGWLSWFLGCLGRTVGEAGSAVDQTAARATFRERLGDTALNERQRRVLGLLMDKPEEMLTAARWARIARCSTEDAHKDIRALVKAGLMESAPGTGTKPRYRLSWPR